MKELLEDPALWGLVRALDDCRLKVPRLFVILDRERPKFETREIAGVQITAEADELDAVERHVYKGGPQMTTDRLDRLMRRK